MQPFSSCTYTTTIATSSPSAYVTHVDSMQMNPGNQMKSDADNSIQFVIVRVQCSFFAPETSCH